MKKLKLTILMVLSMVLATFIPTVGTVSAAETINSNDTLEETPVIIEKNTKYEEFEKEFSRIKNNSRSEFSTGIYRDTTKKQIANLITKYDGAEITVFAAGKYSTKFVNGGVNSYASNKSGMGQLRSDLAMTATLLLTDGTLGGAAIAGPLGALVGLLGSGILGNRCSGASNTMKSWINVGSSRGGVRITLTEQFAISSLNSQKQSPIKKL